MSKHQYIIKSLAPWMIDELLAFAELGKFELIFLREQDKFYQDEIGQLRSKGVSVLVKPFKYDKLFKKFRILIAFLFTNLFKFRFNYNLVIGIKTMLWFIKLDLSKFSASSSMHAQFATQAALLSYLIKKYYKDQPEFSFTFHAHDIYFDNRWFKLLVNNCHKAFSISNYNIIYVKDKFIDSEKIVLARLGVFTTHFNKEERKIKEKHKTLTLGLISWFVEKKGILFLLQAMLSLKNQGNGQIRLKLAGDGPLKEQFLKFIEQHELQANIDYLGKIKGEEKLDFFKEIDVFVLPSITLNNDKDGIPVVLMEAIAARLPLISTDVSGIPEICHDEFNGFLIKEKSVEAIVKAILTLNEKPILIQQYSNNSFSLSKEYDIILNSKKKVKELAWN